LKAKELAGLEIISVYLEYKMFLELFADSTSIEYLSALNIPATPPDKSIVDYITTGHLHPSM